MFVFVFMKSSLSRILSSKTPKIYKNKKLNNANFGDFNHNDYQVFLHLVSKIGGVDEVGKYLQPEQLEREYILTAREFSEVFNTDLSNSYKLLHKACKKLMKTSVMLERPDLKEIWEINVCSMAKYNKHEGSIVVEFTDRIMPYLAQVKQKFVLYNIKEIANFGSLYTTRLYELVQEFKETGWVLKSVEQLREAFAVGNKFKAYKDFKKYTFRHACQEINDNYDMNLGFKEIKEGRKVVAIEFSFKKTTVSKRVDQDGKTHSIYNPPKQKRNVIKTLKERTEQLSFEELSLEQNQKNEPKSVRSIFSNVLAKLTKLSK